MADDEPGSDGREPDDREPEEGGRKSDDREPDERSTDDRARAAIDAIANGADPSAESFTLANRYTDEQTARLTAWLRRIFGGRR